MCTPLCTSIRAIDGASRLSNTERRSLLPHSNGRLRPQFISDPTRCDPANHDPARSSRVARLSRSPDQGQFATAEHTRSLKREGIAFTRRSVSGSVLIVREMPTVEGRAWFALWRGGASQSMGNDQPPRRAARRDIYSLSNLSSGGYLWHTCVIVAQMARFHSTFANFRIPYIPSRSS